MIAPQRFTVSEPVPGGTLFLTYGLASRDIAGGPDPKRDPQPGPVHSSPHTPSALLRLDSERPWESGSPALRLVAAAIADALAGRPWDGPTMQGVWLRVVAEAEGRVGLNGREIPGHWDPELRRALIGPSALDLVLGYTDDQTDWHPGLAALTPPERDAVEYWLSPPGQQELEARLPGESSDPSHRTAREVRDLMDRRRRRHGMPLAIKTVQNHLASARGKLRRCADPGAINPPEAE